MNSRLCKLFYTILMVNVSVWLFYLVAVDQWRIEEERDAVRVKPRIAHRRKASDISKGSNNDFKAPYDPIDYSKREVFVLDDIPVFDFRRKLEIIVCDDCDFRSVSRSVYVYSVYYDVRRERHIRMVAIVASYNHGNVECIFHGNSTAVKASFQKSVEDHNLPFAAHLITCPVPDNVNADAIDKFGVIVVGNDSNEKEVVTTFSVSVPKPETRKREFTVCIPPLYDNVSVPKVVEFIEVTRMLGANFFTFYDYDIEERLRQVLKAYEDDGILEVKSWKHKFTHENVWYYGQSASVWDCMFHNMEATKYIALNDVDEFIVPRNSDNWHDMMKKMKGDLEDNVAAYRFRSVVFDNTRVKKPPDHDPEIRQLITLDTVVRDLVPNEMRSKMIVDPQRVKQAGIHHLAQAIDQQYVCRFVRDNDALLHHYRWFEKKDVDESALLIDQTMWNYSDKIMRAYDERKKWLKERNIYI